MTQLRRPRLAYVTQWFAPEPTAVPVWIAEALQRQGWDVSVVTGIPNYPDGVVKDGYRAWRPQREIHQGMRLVRAPLYPSHDGSAIGRIANYLSWALSVVIVGRSVLRGSDAVVVYSSPVTAGLAAHLRRHRTPFVLIVQDVWPDSVFASGFLSRAWIRRLVEGPVRRLCDWHYRSADRVAVIAPGMRDRLIARGVDPAKVALVYNWVDERAFQPGPRAGRLHAQLGISPDDFVLMYAGNHGAAQRLDVAVDAVAALADDGVHLVMVGNGIEKAPLMARAAGIDNIHFCDPVPVEQVGDLMADADAQLVSLDDHELFRIALPSKVQAAMASGSVVVAAAPGDAARIVEEAGAGLACAPGSVNELEAALRKLSQSDRDELDAMRGRARAYYDEHMSEAVGGLRLAGLVRAAIDERRVRR